MPPPQPWIVRVTHWVNVVLLVIMAGSGLRILGAHPMLGPVGAEYEWYPLQGTPPPDALTLGSWLAGARHWHFAFAWLFAANALVYVVYLAASGEWRRRLFLPRRDLANAGGTFLYYLRLRRTPPPQDGLYNGLQRLAYTSILALAPLLVLTGLALYKPVQLPWLTALLGGYDTARTLHLLLLAAVALFALVHVVQVLLHPRTLGDMITGGRRREAGS